MCTVHLYEYLFMDEPVNVAYMTYLIYLIHSKYALPGYHPWIEAHRHFYPLSMLVAL
jgi:hypothetical protein